MSKYTPLPPPTHPPPLPETILEGIGALLGVRIPVAAVVFATALKMHGSRKQRPVRRSRVFSRVERPLPNEPNAVAHKQKSTVHERCKARSGGNCLSPPPPNGKPDELCIRISFVSDGDIVGSDEVGGREVVLSEKEECQTKMVMAR